MFPIWIIPWIYMHTVILYTGVYVHIYIQTHTTDRTGESINQCLTQYSPLLWQSSYTATFFCLQLCIAWKPISPPIMGHPFIYTNNCTLVLIFKKKKSNNFTNMTTQSVVHINKSRTKMLIRQCVNQFDSCVRTH